MASSLKPIKIYGHHGPNPQKVIMIVEQLGLPHEVIKIALTNVKTPEYLAVNPNGRLPAIYDPNTDLTLWESGAIIEYLVETYDKDNKISFPKGSNESHLTKQWLYYQATGQGPYYGQGVWFIKYHPEKVSSAVERYKNEANRVTAVLEGHLAKQKATAGADGPWLVGNKLTFADFAFFMWQFIVTNVPGIEFVDHSKYPNVKAWIEKLASLPSVQYALAQADL